MQCCAAFGKVVDFGLGIAAVTLSVLAKDSAGLLQAPTIYMRNYLTAAQYAAGLLLAFNVISLVWSIYSCVQKRKEKAKTDEEAPAENEDVWPYLGLLPFLLFSRRPVMKFVALTAAVPSAPSFYVLPWWLHSQCSL
mgnify:CR=1 FL=1